MPLLHRPLPADVRTAADKRLSDRLLLRLVMGMGAVVYPLAGWMLDELTGSDHSDLGGRVSVAGFFLVALLASFRYGAVRDRLRPVFYGLCALTTLHLVHQNLISSLSPIHVVDFLACLVGFGLLFERARHLLCYLAFAGLLAGVSAFQVTEPQFRPLHALYLTTAAGSISYLVLHVRYRIAPVANGSPVSS